MKTFLMVVSILAIVAELGCSGTSSSNSSNSSSSPVAPYVSKVVVTPAKVTVQQWSTQQFSAQAYDQNGKTMSGITFTWSATDTNNDSLPVSTSGLVTTESAGTFTLAATGPNEVSGSAQLTVSVTPVTITLTSSIPAVQQTVVLTPLTPEVLTLKAQVLVAGAETNATVNWTCGGTNSCSRGFATVGNTATFNSTGLIAGKIVICASYTYQDDPNLIQSCLSVTYVNPPITNLSGQWVFTFETVIIMTADLTQTTTATGVVLASNGFVTVSCPNGNTWIICGVTLQALIGANEPPCGNEMGMTGTLGGTGIELNLQCDLSTALTTYVALIGSLNFVGTPPSSLSTAVSSPVGMWTGVQTSD